MQTKFITLTEISKQAGHPIPPAIKGIVSDPRIVVRCGFCRLVQWETKSGICRKCAKSLWSAEQLGKDTFIERELNKRLAARIDARRRQLGIGLGRLADLCLISPATLSRWLHGKTPLPRMTTLFKLSSVLGMSLAEMIKEVEG
jgi:hypothetical protein